MRSLAPLLALLAAWAIPPPAAPKVGTLTLDQLLRWSDVVVIGRVEAVHTVQGENPRTCVGCSEIQGENDVAVVRVERTIAGPPVERLLYIATSTWTCDVSDAVAGERALYFLRADDWMLRGGEALRAEVERLADGDPVLALSHSGRGRMPLVDLGGAPHATLWAGNLRLPESLPLIEHEDPERSHLRAAPLDALLELVTSAARGQGASLRLSLPESPGSSGRLARVRAWEDGALWIGLRRGPSAEVEPDADRRRRLGPLFRDARVLPGDPPLGDPLRAPFERGAPRLELVSKGGAWTAGATRLAAEDALGVRLYALRDALEREGRQAAEDDDTWRWPR